MNKLSLQVGLAALTLAQAGVQSLAAGPPANLGEELFKLTASDAARFRVFGQSVSVSGNVAIVGAPGAGDDGLSPGSAHLFDLTTGQNLLTLTASDATMQDQFGSSVAISGNRAIVGAYGKGAAYLFDASTGQELHKLTVAKHRIGDSVAISGNIAIVGSPYGAACLFDVSTGQELYRLTASDSTANDYFGYSVGISGDLAIVGALSADNGDGSYGAAYLFDVTTGQELYKLTSPNPADLQFGTAVAISSNLAIVGTSVSGQGNSGAAYLFDVSTGEGLFTFTAPDPGLNDGFGNSVAIGGNAAIVGAAFDSEIGPSAGAAYLFDVHTGQRTATLRASDPAANSVFGTAVAIHGNFAIVGASEVDAFTGAAYVYSTVPEPATVALFALGLPILLYRRLANLHITKGSTT